MEKSRFFVLYAIAGDIDSRAQQTTVYAETPDEAIQQVEKLIKDAIVLHVVND